MIKVICNEKEQYMSGNELLKTIIEHPESLSHSATGDRKEYILELCEHITDCCYCEYPEYYLVSNYPGYAALLHQRGLAFTKEVLESYGLHLGDVFVTQKAIFKDDYINGFVHQIDLNCSWYAMTCCECTKGYCYGLMDAESITKLLEIR